MAGLQRRAPGFCRDPGGSQARVINTILASEFGVLARALSRIAAGHFSTRDFTLERLRAALQLYALEFPVYRTYVTSAGTGAADRRLIAETIVRARGRWHGPDPHIFDFLRDAVTLDLAANPGYSAPRVRAFALKLQQFTGPLMAKAMEDTAFYWYHRLLAFNEVGGDPTADELPLPAFHNLQQQRVETGACGLTATATHDTKRGEDGGRILLFRNSRKTGMPASRTGTAATLPWCGIRMASVFHQGARVHAISGARGGAGRARWTALPSSGCRTMPSRRRARARSKRAGPTRMRHTKRPCAISWLACSTRRFRQVFWRLSETLPRGPPCWARSIPFRNWL